MSKLACNRSQQKLPGDPWLGQPSCCTPWMSPPGEDGDHIPPTISLSYLAPSLCPGLLSGNQARDSVNNLTMWKVMFDTLVFERRAWCLAVSHANPTCAHQPVLQMNGATLFKQRMAQEKGQVSRGREAILGQKDCSSTAQTQETQGTGGKQPGTPGSSVMRGRSWWAAIHGCAQKQVSSPAPVSPKALSPHSHLSC